MNTALLISRSEWSFALENAGGAGASGTVLGLFRAGDGASDAVSLMDKGLARISGGALTLDPLLRFLARSALSAERVWEPFHGAVAIKCPKLYLLITPYERNPNMIKIAPFQGADELNAALAENIEDVE
jgi:hypothetical protein